jgi:hypothetical protein
MSATCPELLVLSQLVDGELARDAAGQARAHVDGCPACAARIERLGRALAAVGAVDPDPNRALEAPRSAAGCLSPSELATWLDRSATEGERGSPARHLEACDVCLREAVAASRVLARLDRGSTLEVPAPLKARVASRWPAPVAEPALSEIVVRVTRAGARLLEQHLIAPLRDLVELPTPAAPALRGRETSAPLSFQLLASEARIRAKVLPAGDGVGLELILEREGGEVLPDQRVFLRRHGRSIYSARTDERGELRMPDLERGVYEVSCPGIGTAFRLDLRA